MQDIDNAISESEKNYTKEKQEIRKFRETFERASSEIFDKMADEHRLQNEKCMEALRQCHSKVIRTKESLEERMRGHEENRLNYSNCDVMEVMKQLKIKVANIQTEDPKDSIYHAQTNTDIKDNETIRSRIESLIHGLVLPNQIKQGMSRGKHEI